MLLGAGTVEVLAAGRDHAVYFARLRGAAVDCFASKDSQALALRIELTGRTIVNAETTVQIAAGGDATILVFKTAEQAVIWAKHMTDVLGGDGGSTGAAHQGRLSMSRKLKISMKGAGGSSKVSLSLSLSVSLSL